MRARLLVPLVCAGVLLGALPVAAKAAGAREAEALELLQRASDAGERLTWTGTQYVASWRDDVADTALVELHHEPGTGSVVTGPSDGDVAGAGSTAALDARVLPHLADSYDLSVLGPGRCTGRAASVVEARRDDGSLAGRFWVDHDTGVLLRRETYDEAGDRVRSSAFVDLDVSTAPVPAAVRTAVQERRPDLDELRRDGWHVPDALPEGFALLEAHRTGPVLQLSYTDGLSTLSLFAQRGALGSEPMDGFREAAVDGNPVWVRHGAPERVVWAGDEQVWTLVSDAPGSAVHAALGVLPHDAPERGGLLSRLGRGLGRLVSLVNPFD